MEGKGIWDKGKWKTKLKKDHLLILLLAGILLLVIALPSGGARKKDAADNGQDSGQSSLSPEANRTAYAQEMEGHLEDVLSQMAGVGEVKAMITLKSSPEKVIEKDVEAETESVTESDSQGGERTTRNSSHGETTVYKGSGSEGQDPYISKEISPQVEGVVVLAEGGNNAVVVKNITEAVQALFGVDTHKIKIMKKN